MHFYQDFLRGNELLQYLLQKSDIMSMLLHIMSKLYDHGIISNTQIVREANPKRIKPFSGSLPFLSPPNILTPERIINLLPSNPNFTTSGTDQQPEINMCCFMFLPCMVLLIFLIVCQCAHTVDR